MKKLIISLVAIVLFASCGSAKKARNSSKPIQPLTLENSKKLGAGYYIDGYYKRLHVFNNFSIEFSAINVGSTTESEIDQNGRAIIKQKNANIIATLPPGTAGQIDSIVRNVHNDVTELKVKYIIESVGPYWIWWHLQPFTSYKGHSYKGRPYMCNNEESLQIYGIPVQRHSLDNYLDWDFSMDEETTNLNLKVRSPFESAPANEKKEKKTKKEEINERKQEKEN